MKIFAFLKYACDPIQCLRHTERWSLFSVSVNIIHLSSCFLHDWIQYCYIVHPMNHLKDEESHMLGR